MYVASTIPLSLFIKKNIGNYIEEYMLWVRATRGNGLWRRISVDRDGDKELPRLVFSLFGIEVYIVNIQH